MKMTGPLFLTFLCTIAAPALGIPIPQRYDGFVYLPTEGPSVVFEAFLDPLCSDSADAWPVLKNVAEYYQSDLLFIVHPFPLPYHHNAFFACRALHIVNKLNNSYTFPLLELFFDHQANFSTSYTMEETPASVVARIVNLVIEYYGDSLPSNFRSTFKKGFSNSYFDLATRISFKFGCARVVTGTPFFFVNGIPLYDADSSWSFDQWTDMINPLLAQVRRAHFSE